MTLVQILVVVLIIVLICGGLPFGPWYAPPPSGTPAPIYHGYGYGVNAGGLLGTILIIILVLWLLRVL